MTNRNPDTLCLLTEAKKHLYAVAEIYREIKEHDPCLNYPISMLAIDWERVIVDEWIVALSQVPKVED